MLIKANILEEKQRPARATTGNLTYANMKKQLRAIHDCGSVSGEDAKVTIETSCSDDKKDTRERDVFDSNSSKKRYNRGKSKGFYKSSSSYNTRIEKENRRNGRRKNPLDRDGNISRCNISESPYHWSTNCPENKHETEAIVLG